MSPDEKAGAARVAPQANELNKSVAETKLDLKSSDDLRSTRLDRYQAKKLAAEIQNTGRVTYTRHCREELTNDSMDIVDVMNILRCGKVEREAEPDQKFGAWRYRIETHRMVAIVEIHSTADLRVVTAWRKRKT